MKATKIILLGGPGAGKGTQAKKLIEVLGIPQISTGDLLRAAKVAGTEVGKEATSYMDRGALVPDNVVLSLVENRLSQHDASAGYILDGFPRTTEQAIAMDSRGIEVERVVCLSVPGEVLTARLCGRRICRGCSASYHTEFRPSTVSGVCDSCGGETYQRKDDSPDVIPNRLSAYGNSTAPLIDFYSQRGIVRVVNGEGDFTIIFEAILKALDK